MADEKERESFVSEQLDGSNVLVTGGAGFIGSSLVRQLSKINCEIIVLDNLVAGTEDNLKETRSLLVQGDILDQDLVIKTMENHRIDYCFHLAAEPYIPKGYRSPEEMFHTNTIGTLRVLKACRMAKVKRILHCSTSEVYGTAQYLPMDEKHPASPHSIYALSKLAGDRMCYILWKEWQLPVVVVRQFNCYGPREAQPYVIPEIISQLSRGDELHLGNIQAKRDFTYVDDAARAAIKVMELSRQKWGVINVGSGRNWSIQEVAREVANVLGKEHWRIVIDEKRLRPFDVDELLCDNSLFNKLTGGMKYTPFREGLKLTVDWYNRNGMKWSWEKNSTV